tara:strand:+ start:459 stop:893 length:435 start_codon:yes stop_codon:yes gene_type:complete
MMRVFGFLAIVCVALSIVMALTAFRYERVDRTQPISGFGKVETLRSPIVAGEALPVRIWREKARGDCPVVSERAAISQDGVVYDLPDAEWSGGSADDPFLDYRYPTLPFMPEGEYQLRVDLTYTCPGGLLFKYTQPPAFFRIAS